ncbi:MAG: hypothetical protein WCF05_06845, partial [Chromatiaceae bacterium]
IGLRGVAGPLMPRGIRAVSPGSNRLMMWPRLRVGFKDVSREEFAAAVDTRLGTKQVSIKLDASVIAFYKSQGGQAEL